MNRNGLRSGVSLFDSLGVLALTGWLVVMFLIVDQGAEITAENRPEVSPEDIAAGFREGEEWHGLYHNDRKVGFIRITRRRLDDGFQLQYWKVLRLTLLGTETRIDSNITVRTDPDFIVRSFEGQLDAGPTSLAVAGTIQPIAGDETRYLVDYTLDLGGTDEHGSMEINTIPRFESDVTPLLMRSHPQPGDRFETTTFDPLSQQARPLILEYQGTETLVIMGEIVEAHRIVHHFGDLHLTIWVNEIGESLREELPLGLIGVRESRAEAMYGVLRDVQGQEDREVVDLIREVSIPFNGVPPDLTRVNEVTWQLGGLSLDRFDLDGGRQSALSNDRGVVVVVRREAGAGELTPGELDLSGEAVSYLAASILVQSDSPPIRERASEIVGDRTTVNDIVEAVGSWVHENMEQVMVVSLPSAREVLETMRGDCNEHATLTTALLRASGVPARIATGVAHLDGAFYYHAWVEYWHDGWRSIDPTWGQLPADLGHIRLTAGGLDRQTALFEAFGRLTVELRQ